MDWESSPDEIDGWFKISLDDIILEGDKYASCDYCRMFNCTDSVGCILIEYEPDKTFVVYRERIVTALGNILK
jgi:hypothetical protein